MQIVDETGNVWQTLSLAEAFQSDETSNGQAFDILSSTAVSVFARRQPPWSQEANTPLELHEDSAPDGRVFRVTTLAQTTRFTVTVHPDATATAADIDRMYAQIRAVLDMILHGAQEDPTIADRLADAYHIHPWICNFCSAAFAHWADAQAHERTVHLG